MKKKVRYQIVLVNVKDTSEKYSVSDECTSFYDAFLLAKVYVRSLYLLHSIKVEIISISRL